jgi:hypothetical protein
MSTGLTYTSLSAAQNMAEPYIYRHIGLQSVEEARRAASALLGDVAQRKISLWTRKICFMTDGDGAQRTIPFPGYATHIIACARRLVELDLRWTNVTNGMLVAAGVAAADSLLQLDVNYVATKPSALLFSSIGVFRKPERLSISSYVASNIAESHEELSLMDQLTGWDLPKLVHFSVRVGDHTSTPFLNFLGRCKLASLTHLRVVATAMLVGDVPALVDFVQRHGKLVRCELRAKNEIMGHL